jgi:hypothetical protein
MSPHLSRDQEIPGLELPENPGSKRLNKSRDFGIPSLNLCYSFTKSARIYEQLDAMNQRFKYYFASYTRRHIVWSGWPFYE